MEARAHRLPLVDLDSETGQEMIVSVLTQYRILKFIAMNVGWEFLVLYVDDLILIHKLFLDFSL